MVTEIKIRSWQVLYLEKLDTIRVEISDIMGKKDWNSELHWGHEGHHIADIKKIILLLLGRISTEICKGNKTKIFVFKFELSRNISWKNSLETTLAGDSRIPKNWSRGFLFHLEDAITFHSSCICWRLVQKYKLRRPGYLAVVEIGSTPRTLLLKEHQQNVQLRNVDLPNVHLQNLQVTKCPDGQKFVLKFG